MSSEDSKQYTSEEKARFREELADAEAQFGVDTFSLSHERHKRRWQRKKDQVVQQIASTKNSEDKERLQQKLLELEQLEKKSAQLLAELIANLPV